IRKGGKLNAHDAHRSDAVASQPARGGLDGVDHPRRGRDGGDRDSVRSAVRYRAHGRGWCDRHPAHDSDQRSRVVRGQTQSDGRGALGAPRPDMNMTMLRRHTQTTDERGVASLEFVLILPILLFVIFTGVELSRAWMTLNLLTSAAREA